MAAERTLHGMAVCAGAGGFEYGLRLALGDDYRCVVFVEREAYAAACLVARMADATLDPAPVWDDVVTFDGRPWRGVVDIVTAGFPCQPWSVAGRRRGASDERWLWPDIARVIREVGPRYVFLENSPELVAGGLEHVLGDLATMGFDAEWDLFSAAETGAPHLRERLYLLAHAGREPVVGIQPQRVAQRGGASLAGRAGEDLELAHANGRRRDAHLGPHDARQPDADRRGDALAVAHADGDGQPCERRVHELLAEGEVTFRHDADRCDGPLFPPDRGASWAEWEPWLAAMPGTEPVVRRDADGLASRRDRLRVLGNGVVPVVAALAFVSLRARLMEGC